MNETAPLLHGCVNVREPRVALAGVGLRPHGVLTTRARGGPSAQYYPDDVEGALAAVLEGKAFADPVGVWLNASSGEDLESQVRAWPRAAGLERAPLGVA